MICVRAIYGPGHDVYRVDYDSDSGCMRCLWSWRGGLRLSMVLSGRCMGLYIVLAGRCMVLYVILAGSCIGLVIVLDGREVHEVAYGPARQVFWPVHGSGCVYNCLWLWGVGQLGSIFIWLTSGEVHSPGWEDFV